MEHLKASASLFKTTPFVLDIVEEEDWDREFNLPGQVSLPASEFDDMKTVLTGMNFDEMHSK